MRRVTVLAVGKLKEAYLREALAEYAKRLSRYTQFEVVELAEARVSEHPSQAEIAQALEKEGQAILSKIPPQAQVVTLCIEGRLFSSEELANELQKMENVSSQVVFIIGSSHGLSQGVKDHSQVKLSLSPMTFPHQLVRVLLAEQIYRVFSINNNGKYHK